MNEDLKKFVDAITAKLDSINGKLEGTCVLCNFPGKNWGVAIPDGDTDALGFGSKDDKTARVAFFPVCKLHDVTTEEHSKRIRIHLALKRTTMCN